MDEASEPGPMPLADPPAELHALVAFLNADKRPAVIVELASSALPTGRVNVIYRNPAWKTFRTTREASEELGVLRNVFQDHVSSGKDIDRLHGKLFEEGMWEVRVWSNYCIVAAAANRGETACDDLHSETQEHNGRNAQSLDWIQNEIPDMSPWVKFIRSINWSATSFGPMRSWSPILRQYVLTMMANPNPRLVIWGDNMTFIYNEACVQLFGREHPRAMGSDATSPWSDSWDTLRPLVESGYRGDASRTEYLPLAIERNNFLEETYWDVTVLPIIGEDGLGVGVFNELTETTPIVTSERRRTSIAILGDKVAGASTLPELWDAVLQGLESSELDVPFAMLYDIVDDDMDADSVDSASPDSNISRKKCLLAGTIGMTEDHADTYQTFALLEHIETGPRIVKSCVQAWKTRKSLLLSAKEGTLPPELNKAFPGRGFGDVITQAMVLPINSATGTQVLGILVIGLNPRSGCVSEYNLWMHIMVDYVEKGASLISLPQEQRRAKRIADEMVNSLAHQLRISTLEVERSEAKFGRLASTAPTGMFMFDADGRIMYVNERYLELLGETREQHDARGPEAKQWQDRIHEDDLDRFIHTWRKIIQEKVPITIEYRLKRPWRSMDKTTGQELSGETWLMALAYPEIEADGSIASIQGWLTDISHRKFSESIITQRLKDALEHKVQAEKFIDMTSHEMRNPLSAILQCADSIVSMLNLPDEESLDGRKLLPWLAVEEIVDAAQTIILCAQHQKRIVDDVLTLSKLDADLLEISPDKVRLTMLVQKALKMYEAEIHRAGIDAKVLIEPSYDEMEIDWVMLDTSRLLQVVINLLTNAIKFTRDSDKRIIKICVGASYERPTGRHHKVNFVPVRHSRHVRQKPPDTSSTEDIYLQIGVYDTGRGLTEDETKSLFQRFQQGSPKTYKKYGGSGLGLFISRELCELQGGQIGVASSNGKTVFTFYVKAKRWVGDANDDTAEQQPALKHFTSASASPIAFTRRGSRVLEDEINQPPTEMRKIHNSDLEIATLSRQLSMSPIARVSPATPLEAMIEETSLTPATKGQTALDMHVLVVEDNVINQKVLSQQLKRAGCIVHVANHGLECLEFLENSTYCSQATPLSIILLDLEMPTMDGLTCIRHIRLLQAQGQIRGHVPVIAVTANARSEQITLAIEAGMDSVVTKPFRVPELVPQMVRLVADLDAKNAV